MLKPSVLYGMVIKYVAYNVQLHPHSHSSISTFIFQVLSEHEC